MDTTRLRIPPDHPAYAGHFPGQPLLPGVLLLALVLEAVLADPQLAERVGVSPRIAMAKFLAPVRPGEELTLQIVSVGQRLGFEARSADRLVATGQFDAARP